MRLKIVLAKVLYSCIGKYLPKSFSICQVGQKRFRAFCAKCMLESCGENVNIERGASFSRRISIGDNSGIGINSHINGPCIIGKNVMMGPECLIFTQNHRFDDVTTTIQGQGATEERKVTIGDDVWIGARVIILPGVSIASHSVIGAGSVVTKNIPEWVVAAGNPAIVKKYRKIAGGGVDHT